MERLTLRTKPGSTVFWDEKDGLYVVPADIDDPSWYTRYYGELVSFQGVMAFVRVDGGAERGVFLGSVR